MNEVVTVLFCSAWYFIWMKYNSLTLLINQICIYQNSTYLFTLTYPNTQKDYFYLVSIEIVFLYLIGLIFHKILYFLKMR